MALRLTIHTGATADPTGPGVHPSHVQEVEVDLDQAGLIIGRAPSSGIHLPHASVSGRHARLFSAEGKYGLEDLGSTNGTRLGGRKLAPHQPEPLALGDAFEVGRIRVCLDGESPGTSPAAANLGTETLARRLVHDLFEVGPAAEPARIVVLSGPAEGRVLDLPSGRVVHVGRGEGCDLVLADPDVSREHVAIERGPGGFLARDLGSKNGVEIAGENLTAGERLLHDGDTLRLGGSCLRFVDPEDRYLRQLEAAPVEAPALTAVAPAAPEAPSRLPAIAMAVAITALLTTLGLALALAFLPHL